VADVTEAESPTTPQASTSRGISAVLPQILGWVGAALVASAALSQVGQSWDDWTDLTRLIVLALALAALAGSGLTVLTLTGGRSALNSSDIRRRIVAVLLALCAPLVAAASYQVLAIADVGQLGERGNAWAVVPAAAGLLAAAVGAWLVRGVMTTLAMASMWAYFGITLLGIFADQPDWVLPVIVAVVGAIWLAAAPGIFPPAALSQALGVAWTTAMLAPVALMQIDTSESTADPQEFAATWTARGLLIGFAATCFVVFARSGAWAWAVGGVIAAAIGALAVAGTALGWITGMLVAGVVLLALSGLLLLLRRRSSPAAATSAPER